MANYLILGKLGRVLGIYNISQSPSSPALPLELPPHLSTTAPIGPTYSYPHSVKHTGSWNHQPITSPSLHTLTKHLMSIRINHFKVSMDSATKVVTPPMPITFGHSLKQAEHLLRTNAICKGEVLKTLQDRIETELKAWSSK